MPAWGLLGVFLGPRGRPTWAPYGAPCGPHMGPQIDPGAPRLNFLLISYSKSLKISGDPPCSSQPATVRPSVRPPVPPCSVRLPKAPSKARVCKRGPKTLQARLRRACGAPAARLGEGFFSLINSPYAHIIFRIKRNLQHVFFVFAPILGENIFCEHLPKHIGFAYDFLSLVSLRPCVAFSR